MCFFLDFFPILKSSIFLKNALRMIKEGIVEEEFELIC